MVSTDGITVDPDAINAFATGFAPMASTFKDQALGDIPSITDQHTSAGTSPIPEGSAFYAAHALVLRQFAGFALDAAAGATSLAEGANAIAVGLSTVEEGNARRIIKVAEGGPESVVNLVALGGDSAPARASAQGVAGVFNPAPAAADRSVAAMHAAAVGPPGAAVPPSTGIAP